MSAVATDRTQEFCLRLMNAETEDEVVSILIQRGYWNDRSVWKPYGDIANNRSIVGNQQSSPVAALVEKIVNSIDAILIAECWRRGIDPTSPVAPQTMRAAIEEFLGVKRGQLQALDAAARTRLAERIQLVAAGTKEKPAYCIVDDGEGQSPDRFPATFLSLIRDNKTNIPFVQGKFNMGGTGVLQFAGTHSFQLIVSRRQPDIPPTLEANPRRDLWGFTLIRRLDPGPQQPQSTYVYLAPGNQILAFKADSIPGRPGRYPEAYASEMQAGTFIKLWNYKLPGRLKSLATLDLRYALEQYLQAPALPTRVCERRPGYRANYYDTTISGLLAVLADKPDDIELETGSPLTVPGVGDIDAKIAVMVDEADEGKRKRYPAGVFFTVNGQLHGELGKEFVSRRTKLDYVADTAVVIIDCTSLPPRVREDLFMASRDRMRQCPERDALEDAIVEYLKDHQGLRELNARRRQSRLASATSEEETAKIIQGLVQSDPTLAQLFGRGERIRIGGGPLPEPEAYTGQRFPTYFRIKNEPQGGLLKKCPVNRTCHVEYETDAANDYLSRVSDPGHIESRGAATLLSVHLWNGKATLRFGLPAGCQVGDRLGVDVFVNDTSRVEPLRSHFAIEVEHEAPPSPPKPPTPPGGSTLLGLPNIVEVRRDEWARHDFNQNSAVQLRSGDDESLDMFINMDNIHLVNEIARRRDLEPTIVNYWFKYGLCLLALGMLFRLKKLYESDETPPENNHQQSLFATISQACEGLAVTVIPVIARLSGARERV